MAASDGPGFDASPLPEPARPLRTVLCWVLALFYSTAALFHLTRPEPFLRIMPGWVPLPEAVVLGTGIAEALGAVALVQPWSKRLRHASAVGLAFYALCVWPANINHLVLDLARPDHGWGLAYHIPRILAQPLLIWLALWAGGVIEWQWRQGEPQNSA